MTRFHVKDPVDALNALFGALLPGDEVYIGIDPGKAGAIAFVPTNKKIEPLMFDMPLLTSTVNTTKKGKNKKGTRTAFAHAEIVEWFRPALENNDRVVVVLERGQPMPADTAKTAFGIGLGYGMWHLFFTVCCFRYQDVMPAVWKKQMGLSKQSKDVSRQLASQKLPKAAKFFTAKSDDGRAEAALLAVYQMQKDKQQ